MTVQQLICAFACQFEQLCDLWPVPPAALDVQALPWRAALLFPASSLVPLATRPRPRTLIRAGGFGGGKTKSKIPVYATTVRPDLAAELGEVAVDEVALVSAA